MPAAWNRSTAASIQRCLVTDEAMENGRVTKLYTFDGLARVDVEEASAGDIVALAGFETIEIGKTFTSIDQPERLLGIAVEEPTISVDFIVNNGPFAGRDGKFVEYFRIDVDAMHHGNVLHVLQPAHDLHVLEAGHDGVRGLVDGLQARTA